MINKILPWGGKRSHTAFPHTLTPLWKTLHFGLSNENAREQRLDEIALDVQLRKTAQQVNDFLGCDLYKTSAKYMQCSNSDTGYCCEDTYRSQVSGRVTMQAAHFLSTIRANAVTS